MLKETKMLIVLGLSLLVLMGCGSEIATHYELCYTIQNDKIEEIARENVVFGDDAIQIVAGADTVALGGQLLTISSTTIDMTDSTATFLTYELIDKNQETIAEVRINGVEPAGFHSIVLTGDYGQIPRGITNAVDAVTSFTRHDLGALRSRGTKSVTDVSNGDEIGAEVE